MAHWGCSRCLHSHTWASQKVYSGRKFWAGHECMTPNQLAESNYNFEQSLIAGAARNRRRGLI